MPQIIYNGAMVIARGEVKYSVTIPPQVAKDVCRYGKEKGIVRIAWANNSLYAEDDCERVNRYKSISKVEPIFIKDLACIAVEGITKFVYLSDEETTNRYYELLNKEFNGELNVFPSRVDFLEIVSAKCSKEKALSSVLKLYGIQVSDTVAIGDGYNDLDMLKFAGLGVAMKNAPQLIKTQCNIVADSCDEEGVAKFIKKYVL